MEGKVISNTSYSDALREYRRLGDIVSVYEKLFDRVEKDYLVEAQTVISIGSGTGVIDLKFLEKLVPKLTKLIAVEYDRSCSEELKENFKNTFPKNVTLEIHISPGQTWQGLDGTDGRADLVLLFHCLYFFNEQERRELYEKCFIKWLKPGGKLLILHDKDLHETKIPFYTNDIYRQTSRKPLVESQTLKEELIDLGFSIEKIYDYEYYQNLQILNDCALALICLQADPPYENEETVKRAMKKLIDEGNKGYTCGDLFSAVNKM